MEHPELWALLAAVIGLASLGGTIWAVRDLAYTPDLTARQKAAWLLALFFLTSIALLFYLALSGRQKLENRRLRAAAEHPTPQH